MQPIVDYLSNYLDLDIFLRASLLILVGIPLLLFLRRWIRSIIQENYSPHYAMLFGKITYYIGFVILMVTVLNQLGFKLGPLLGAAGIASVAIGFASQTSISNIISGFFLIGEKAFETGDIINVNGTIGVVLSIDTMSVKLRAFDNRFIRIPNEMMLKSQVINITRFPIRRAELKISVAYKEDLTKVQKILADVVEKNPLALQEPAMNLIFEGFNSSSIDFQLNVWTAKEHFLLLRTGLYMQIKKRFDEEGIEIPFPHLSIYTGEASKPFPVMNMTEKEPKQEPKLN
ncbi:MAG: mechanosensitive ion channel family protein [Balneolales bacterium]|nr:mechanosensitive ion channel family protein [Balneolales bacterium]